MILRSPRGQGAFEYVLMLSGVLLIVITIVFVLQGSLAGANNTLSSQASTFNSTTAIDIVSQLSPNLGALHATGNLPANETFPCCVNNGATTQCTSIPDYTAVLFHMDQTTGTAVADSTNAGFNGTCFGMGANCRWVAGKTGNGIEFQAGSDTVKLIGIPVDLSVGPKKNSVEFWMYWHGSGSQMPFGWNGCYNLYLSGSLFGFNNGGGNVEGISDNTFLVNSWHHIVAIFPNGVTIDNNTAELWIDGIRRDVVHQTGSVGSPSASSNAAISSYYTATSYRFDGVIDEFAIYSRALTPTQIQQHYLRGVARFYNQCFVDTISCPLGRFNRNLGECA